MPEKLKLPSLNLRANNYRRNLLFLLNVLLQLMNSQQSSRSDRHYYDGGKKLTFTAQGKHN